MPEKKTIERAKEDLAEGKSASTAAGEFVREEIDHVREGKHGARSPKQAIAIGLSKARRAGVPLAPPRKGSTSGRTRKQAKRDLAKGQGRRKSTGKSPRRSRAVEGALKRESRSTASKRAMSKQAKSSARKRSPSSRSAAAKKAAATRKRRSRG